MVNFKGDVAANRVGADNGSGNNLVLTALEFFKYLTSFRLADALFDNMLRGLSGYAAELLCFKRNVYNVAHLGFFIIFNRLVNSYLICRIFNLLGNGFAKGNLKGLGLRVDNGFYVLYAGVILTHGDYNGIFNLFAKIFDGYALFRFKKF